MAQRTGKRWAIVLAGGAGTRLDALTRDAGGRSVPKQYCSLRGGPSLLGETLARAASLAGDRVLAVVAPEHRPFWEPELATLAPEHRIVQPRNRGTAPGVLLPLLHVVERDPDATVAFLPSDHHVGRERVLRRTLRNAFRAVESSQRPRIALLGMTPEHDETQYGWILPESHERVSTGSLLPVHAFVEKPPVERARALRSAGGLWNSFLVVGRAQSFLDLFALRRPDLFAAFASAFGSPERERVLERLYGELVPSDFCRDLLEGAEDRLRVCVVPPCEWTDLGTPVRVAECLARCAPQASDASEAPIVLARAR